MARKCIRSYLEKEEEETGRKRMEKVKIELRLMKDIGIRVGCVYTNRTRGWVLCSEVVELALGRRPEKIELTFGQRAVKGSVKLSYDNGWQMSKRSRYAKIAYSEDIGHIDMFINLEHLLLEFWETGVYLSIREA